jgi:hypothetical protein
MAGTPPIPFAAIAEDNVLTQHLLDPAFRPKPKAWTHTDFLPEAQI